MENNSEAKRALTITLAGREWPLAKLVAQELPRDGMRRSGCCLFSNRAVLWAISVSSR